jgi:hypothetical protein
VAERDAVTGKLGNEKDKKKKVYPISVEEGLDRHQRLKETKISSLSA